MCVCMCVYVCVCADVCVSVRAYAVVDHACMRACVRFACLPFSTRAGTLCSRLINYFRCLK